MRPPQSAETFLRLLAPLRDGLYGYARRALWNRDLAEDVVQEAVLTAWRSFRDFEPGSSFRAWTFKIMTNTVFTYNKRSGRERVVFRLEEEMQPDMQLECETAWALILEDAEQLIDALDERTARALDALSPDERQCLLLRLLEGFSYKEIASMLDIPLGTVMSHVHRARMKLRERLAGLALELGIIRESQP